MKLAPATPELPVRDVAEARRDDRDRMGFGITWHDEAGAIGAVSQGDCALFLRATGADPQPVTVWIFTDDIDRPRSELTARGADLADPVENKPRRPRRFTLRARNRNLIRFHRDFRAGAGLLPRHAKHRPKRFPVCRRARPPAPHATSRILALNAPPPAL